MGVADQSRAEQARAALAEIARLMETHTPVLNKAFHLLGEGALRGPAAVRLRSDLMRDHAQLRHAFTLAFDQTERLARTAEGPRVPRPVPAGTPIVDLTPGPAALVGGDPDRLLALATELTRAGTALRDAADTVTRLLLRLGLDATPGRLIAQTADWATHQRPDLLRRRESLLREAALGTDPTLATLLGYTLGNLPSMAEPGAADGQAARLQALAAEKGTPEQRAARVRAFLVRLPKDQRSALALSHPDLIGNLDGAPHNLRYAANRLRIQRALALEKAKLLALPHGGPDRGLIQRRIDRFTEFLEPRKLKVDGKDIDETRHFLLFDPSGDGRAAEVFGDLTTAKHVAISVPGVTNRLDNFNSFSNATHGLYRLARTRGRTDIAGIAWLGYDTPGFADGQLPDSAAKGGPALRAFRSGLNLAKGAETTLLAHSYGTRVSYQALRQGADFDNVVFMGSPGFERDVRSVAGMRLPRDTRVYAMRAPGDYISYSENAGPDPASFPDITRLGTGEGAVIPRGHSDYYSLQSLSLRNLGAVAWAMGEPRTVTSAPRQEAWWATSDQVFFERLLAHVPPDQMREFAAKVGPLVRDVELGRVKPDFGDQRSWLWILHVMAESDLLDYLSPAELNDALGAAASAQVYWELRERGAPESAARAATLASQARIFAALLPLQAVFEAVRVGDNALDVGGAAAEGIAKDVQDAVESLDGFVEGIGEGVRSEWPFDAKERRP